LRISRKFLTGSKGRSPLKAPQGLPSGRRVEGEALIMNISSRMNSMPKKVIDLMTYRIEKTLKENGFEVKKDDNKNIKILIKLSNND
jgi:hypothetical protein